MAGSKKIAAHVKVEYPELEAGTKEVREVVKSAIEQAKQAAASTPDLVSALSSDDLALSSSGRMLGRFVVLAARRAFFPVASVARR
eukprot:COSAG04_NODE_1865_length_5359_cov_3.964449_5_plen_86_part_00